MIHDTPTIAVPTDPRHPGAMRPMDHDPARDDWSHAIPLEPDITPDPDLREGVTYRGVFLPSAARIARMTAEIRAGWSMDRARHDPARIKAGESRPPGIRVIRVPADIRGSLLGSETWEVVGGAGRSGVGEGGW